MRRAAAIGALLALAGCGRIGFDDLGRASSDASGMHLDSRVPPVCANGTCACSGLATCNLACLAGRCPITCTGQSECQVTCDQAPCDITCSDQATCNFTCAAGGCTATYDVQSGGSGACARDCRLSCIDQSSCSETCDQPGTCSCTGVGCQ